MYPAVKDRLTPFGSWHIFHRTICVVSAKEADMSSFRILLVVLGLCLWAGSLNAEKVYTWHDKDGVLNMTNSPRAVPPAIRAAKGINKFQPVQRPTAPRVPKVEKVKPPLPPSSAEKPKDAEAKRLREALEGLENRNQSIKKLQEMLNKLAK